MDKEVVKELIQDELSSENIKVELKKVLSDGINRNSQLMDYNDLKGRLGGNGASIRAAAEIQNLIS